MGLEELLRIRKRAAQSSGGPPRGWKDLDRAEGPKLRWPPLGPERSLGGLEENARFSRDSVLGLVLPHGWDWLPELVCVSVRVWGVGEKGRAVLVPPTSQGCCEDKRGGCINGF